MNIFIRGLNSCMMRRQKLEQYRRFLVANGHSVVDDLAKADTVLVWTCGFRGDVRDNSLSELRRYAKQYRGKRVIAAGCLPDIVPQALEDAFDGDIVNWRDDAEKMEKLFGAGAVALEPMPPIYCEPKVCDDAAAYRKEHPGAAVTFHDQFIKLVVSEGCGYQCTYCSERLMFPKYRSFPEGELVEACRKVVEATGERDVMLLADSLGEYGRDIGTSLPSLLRKLKAIHPGLRFALNNLQPAEFLRYYDDMDAFLRDGWIRHLNLPIQSGSSRVLRLMKRGYTREDLERVFGLVRARGLREFDTHVIVGFPGETDEDFRETISFLLGLRPKYVLASAYMEAPEMPSSRLPDKVDAAAKSRRSKELAEAMARANIICNTDDSELIAARCHALNHS